MYRRPGFLTSIVVLLPTLVVWIGSPARAAANQAEQASSTISLAGEWNFRVDPEDQGIAEKWFDVVLPRKTRLPGSTDQNGYGTKTTGREAFWLNRVYKYVGPAWYQKEVVVPEPWRGKRIVLLLERCHWETRLWVDGVAAGMQDSLCTPHEYDLSKLMTPGKHRLTVRVDNRVKINVGKDAHSVADHTQTNWNGIVGRIELLATDNVWIDDVQVYPEVQNKTAKVLVTVGNTNGQGAEGELTLEIVDLAVGPYVTSAGRPPIPSRKARCPISRDKQTQLTIDLPMGDELKLWDEFSPALYGLSVSLTAGSQGKQFADRKRVRFGMREFGTRGTQFTINGRLTFLRGTLECCIFPLTGYPPMEAEGWQRIIRIAKAHGLNHFRFHSWCPPEAAFEAADREGFMFHVETPVWTVLGGDPKVDAFVYAEGDRILKAYGNHPSFCMLAVGNEPSGKNQHKFLSKIVAYWKKNDPRRVYTGASGWPVTPESDYHSRPQPRGHAWGAGLRSRFNAGPLATDVDYRRNVANFQVPIVSHEIGQWCVYPNFKEIQKYTGVVRARNFEIFRDSLAEHQMLDQAEDFLMASGKLQALLYKEEIETALRTPGFGGFQLLDLHDFPGQGTALVGVLDAFWDSKGYIQPKTFHQFCCETVPLLRMKKCTWTAHETFQAEAQVAHYGRAPIKNALPVWSIKYADGRDLASGKLPRITVPLGGGTKLGSLDLNLAGVAAPAKLVVALSLDGTPYRNQWDIWVYPSGLDIAPPKGVLIAGGLDEEVFNALKAGKKVLLMPPPAAVRSDVPAGFTTIFWNTQWTRRQPPHTLGILCDPKHPALARFPTESHSNWQWWDLVSKSRSMILDEFPAALRPIVQVIDDWNTNRRLGLVFEAQVGGGKLLVCSIELRSNLQQRPVARQMLHSLLQYINSPAFAPKQSLDPKLIQGLLRQPPR